MSIAINIFNRLMQTGIVNAKGETVFVLNNIKTIINDSSIVGNVIQEWLKAFMNQEGIHYRTKQNSQEFPDFLLNSSSDIKDLLEVKCFKRSPNFDVANFNAYARSLLDHAYRLDADYLIFEYIEVHGGIIIKNIWLKKVWQICSKSDRADLKIQWKQGVPVNIRPALWYSNRTNYPPFSSRQEFVAALNRVVNTNTSPEIQKNWMKRVSEKYLEQTGSIL